MSESYGGTSSRRSNSMGVTGKIGSMGGTRRDAGLLGGTMGGTGRAATARGSPLGAARPPSGGTIKRPLSAPRARGNGPPLFGSANMEGTAGAKARVEESRMLKEAGFWGREEYVPMELPAYWSVATYGEPFNDFRKAMSTSAQGVGGGASGTGPATQQILNLRKSLIDGKRYFNRSDLSPIADGMDAEPLKESDRVMLFQRLQPYQRVHAYKNMWDVDTKAKDFIPWTQLVWDKLDRAFWARNRELGIRLAVQKLENMMRRHLLYTSENRNNNARAPSSSAREVLREAFWKVDPQRTGMVSLAQFLQVWQNILMLMQFDDIETKMVTGKTRMALQPLTRFILDQNMCAGLFVKFGFDKEGLMPYEAFSQALCAAPSRLLGEELVLDKKEESKHGLSDEADISYIEGGAKVIYPKCEGGVFPPNGFDRRLAERSRLAPSAHMWLEHVYGYAGMDVKATNIFYSHNTTETNTEIIYYTGMVGVVLNKELWLQGKPSQRFFHGHDNDIECIALHPGRRFVATGQQKATGPKNVPFVCIWDADTGNQLQRLPHGEKERGVIAVAFSGNINGKEDKKGGEILVTITANDKHTVHVWRWMTLDNVFARAVNIPGWKFDPEKKLPYLKANDYYYKNPEIYEDDRANSKMKRVSSFDGSGGNDKYKLKQWAEEPTQQEVEKCMEQDHPLLNRARNIDIRLNTDWEEGLRVQTEDNREDKSFSILYEGPGQNGTPPMVYGVAWNPLKPHDGGKGSEFCTYGVKHLKTWIVSDGGGQKNPPPNQWTGTSASFGKENINNVLSALYVPALHYMAAPGDSCIITGFATGQIGLWIPPFPTRAGSTYQLMRKFEAHDPGCKIRLNDGSQVYGGVRVLRMRSPKKIGGGQLQYRFLSAGSDGCVIQWELEAPTGKLKDGTPMRGVNLKCLATKEETTGPNRFHLGTDPKHQCMIVGLDCIAAKQAEFVAGTSDCDIWEVDDTPRMLVEGQEEDVWTVTCHPTKPNIFATTCMSGCVRIFDTTKYDVIKSASVGFPITGAGFSCEPYGASAYRDPNKANFHLALGSQGLYTKGDWHKIAIVDADTLQPLKLLKEPKGQMGEIKYSPPGGPGILAAGSQDMGIYLYNVRKDYHFIGRCTGHSGTIQHLDWTLPISLPGHKLHGEMLFMAADASGNIMYWNPKSGRAVTQNQRDAAMHTMTCKLGFGVMGIWPDNSGPDDINAVCRAKRGAPTYAYKDLGPEATASDRAARVDLAREEDSADGVPGGGYLCTADDFSTISLLNYPCVWDDAPSKLFFGHASHVMCIRFACDDRLVISAGGHDRGLYQWRTIGVNHDDAWNDKCIMAARKNLIKNRAPGDPIFDEAAGWVPQDGEGKIYGPAKTVRTSRAFTESAPVSPDLKSPNKTTPPNNTGGDSDYSFPTGSPAAGNTASASFDQATNGGAPNSRPTTPVSASSTPRSAANSRPGTPPQMAAPPSSRPGTAGAAAAPPVGSRPGTPSQVAAPPSSRPGTAGTAAAPPVSSRPGTPSQAAGAAGGSRPGTAASGGSCPRTPSQGAAAAPGGAAAVDPSGGSSLFNSSVNEETAVPAVKSSAQGPPTSPAPTPSPGGSRPSSARASQQGAPPKAAPFVSNSSLMSGDISGLGDGDVQAGSRPGTASRNTPPPTAGAQAKKASSGGDSSLFGDKAGDSF